ncbi:MAG: ATP-dependent DNA helicase RecG [Gemmatimonadota bacterium]|nr:MAG: ATP-dependent DNA helicase RecG [Gemmatimonadota bacterium]
MALALETPVQFLKGVGPRRAEAFQRMGVTTVEDLLYHVPHRYLDATSVTPIAKAAVGNEVTLVGRVVSKAVVPTRRRLRIFRAVLRDQSGIVECAWPGQAYLDRIIKQGQLLLVTGPVKHYHGRQVVPREQVVLAEPDDEEREDEMGSGMVLPVYPATEGLSHRQIRRLIADHLEEMLGCVTSSLPKGVTGGLGLVSLRQALEALHRPADPSQPEAGRRRLAFDELFDLQLVVARARFLAQSAHKGYQFEIKKELTTALKQKLPFELTTDQRTAVREITRDMTSADRMHRLLMGDVGTGKTVVALFAMLLALENEHQAVFMAPTELLAEQHAHTITTLLAPLGIVPEVLIGRLSQGEKKAIRERIAAGSSRIVVGTHALIQEHTKFWRLGLAVIDEQHRFGVEQRAALIEKGEAPDVLLLSATPIPRTLALTLYGDLDISTLKRKPVSQSPVRTGVRSNKDRAAIYRFLQEQCKLGRQAFVVYPVIDESEKVDLKAATTMATELGKRLAPLSVGLVHGKMKAEERDTVMRSFRDGDLDVLVATTVIEVGIDVPNATVMVIEHPERFGLAQLHQLRGRVGRGREEGHCILLTDDYVSARRLKQFSRTADGFKIAELDLKERGIGELAGVRQSGGFNLRYADLATDDDLVIAARRAALEIIAADPDLSHRPHLELRKRIERRYERGMELFRIG